MTIIVLVVKYDWRQLNLINKNHPWESGDAVAIKQHSALR